jgi:homogentisate 1,2-dioxygenase
VGYCESCARREFTAVRSDTKRTQRFQINKPMMHHKKVEKQEQTKPKISIRKEIKILELK